MGAFVFSAPGCLPSPECGKDISLLGPSGVGGPWSGLRSRIRGRLAGKVPDVWLGRAEPPGGGVMPGPADGFRLTSRAVPGWGSQTAGLSGGVRLGQWRMGLSVLHQRNLLHSNSWAQLRTNSLSGDVTTNALLTEFSYGIPVFSSFSLNLNGALGYRKTTTSLEYLGTPSSKVDNGFVWSAGTGLEWSFSEQASLILAYRYFAEETVPTHNADLGLEFDF